jgi:hypothetical protein
VTRAIEIEASPQLMAMEMVEVRLDGLKREGTVTPRRDGMKMVPEAKLDLCLAPVSKLIAPGALIRNGAADNQSPLKRVVWTFRVDSQLHVGFDTRQTRSSVSRNTQ